MAAILLDLFRRSRRRRVGWCNFYPATCPRCRTYGKARQFRAMANEIAGKTEKNNVCRSGKALDQGGGMRGVLGSTAGSAVLLAAMVASLGAHPGAQAPATQPTGPTFKGGVDLVTIRAIVRDPKGRPVTSLTRDDFELLDNGTPHPVLAVEQDNGPVGLALLFDISGSMDVNDRFGRAREQGYFLLSGLRNGEDEAAIYAFDSRLHVIQPFTTELDRLRGTVTEFSRWGMTSLHDAIASASRTMDTRATRRRALVVLTDGIDTGSKLTPSQVSAIASSIDLPVYIVALVQEIDDPRQGGGNQQLAGELADLARWTGGQLFVSTSMSEASAVARQITTELRQQYLIAFEPGATPGWHSVEVKVRRKGHTVQARSGYVAGSAGPVS
jgi:Ca-activated chloride channel family protein